MIERIKQVLLTQYIGAIIIALLIWQAIAGVVSMVLQPLMFYMNRLNERPHQSLFGSPPPENFRWANAYVPGIIDVALQILFAYLLIRWLYLRETVTATEDAMPEVGSDAK